MMRHGIMHGRELGYGTRRNSTQALATLLAVIVWAQPIARARIDAANSEREAAHAGTHDRDLHGRRLWRAGFVEAKRGLQALADYQASFHHQHGRYAASVDEIDPDRLLREDFPNAATAAAPDRQTDRAWAHTGSEYVFGLAGTAGDAIRWSYAGIKVPDAGPAATSTGAMPSRTPRIRTGRPNCRRPGSARVQGCHRCQADADHEAPSLAGCAGSDYCWRCVGCNPDHPSTCPPDVADAEHAVDCRGTPVGCRG